MRHYKYVRDGHILAIGSGPGFTEISESEFNRLLDILKTRPTDGNHVLTEDLTWEKVEETTYDPESLM